MTGGPGRRQRPGSHLLKILALKGASSLSKPLRSTEDSSRTLDQGAGRNITGCGPSPWGQSYLCFGSGDKGGREDK